MAMRIYTLFLAGLLALTAAAQTATIEDVTLEFNAYEGNKRGMRIFTKFQVDGAKGHNITVSNFFYKQDKSTLVPARLQGYNTSDGYVTVQNYDDATYDCTRWGKFPQFIPYDALPGTAGRNVYWVRTMIWDQALGRYITEEDYWQAFELTCSKVLPPTADNFNQSDHYHNYKREDGEECTFCNGTGKDEKYLTCMVCNGSGSVPHYYTVQGMWGPQIASYPVECTSCDGTGVYYSWTYCAHCGGLGRKYYRVDSPNNGNQGGGGTVPYNYNYGGGTWTMPSSSSYSSSSSSSSTSTRSRCPTCGGTGICTSCGGLGVQQKDRTLDPITCPSCRGGRKCFNCYGKGYL